MKIGYAKIGRSWNLDPTNGTATGGDADVARALHILADARPNDEIILLGRNSGEPPSDAGYPSNVTNPWTQWKPQMKKAMSGRSGDADLISRSMSWYEKNTLPSFLDLDALIIWAGQHGTSNMPIPMVKSADVTTPQTTFVLYASFIINGLNQWRDQKPEREEIWLCPDPRNYLKARDIKWPRNSSVIAQYEYVRDAKHYRFNDTSQPHEHNLTAEWDDANVWLAPDRYTYDALELTALPHPGKMKAWCPWMLREPFGMVVNENRAYVSKNRLGVLKEWVLPYWPECDIRGVWTEKSKVQLGRLDISPTPYSSLAMTLQGWKSTLTTPASGSGWATAKPWECFAYGTVCFFHPQYDDQDWILRDASKELREWLRVSSATDLKKRVDHLDKNEGAWTWLVTEQRKYYEQKYMKHHGGVASILRRL